MIKEKIHINLLQFLIVLSLSSCFSVKTNNPLPSDAKDVNHFPRELRGCWRETDEEEDRLVSERFLIEISRKEIAFYQEKYMMNSELFSSDYSWSDNHELLDSLGNKVDYLLKNDTIYYFESKKAKNIFSDSLKLRSSGEYYLLNVLDEDGWWKTLVFSLEEDSLFVLKMAKENADLAIRLGWEETTTDFIFQQMNSRYLLGDFTSVQLNDFITQGGFSDSMIVLVRTNNLQNKIKYKN